MKYLVFVVGIVSILGVQVWREEELELQQVQQRQQVARARCVAQLQGLLGEAAARRDSAAMDALQEAIHSGEALRKCNELAAGVQ
jgi:hypothetical protein